MIVVLAATTPATNGVCGFCGDAIVSGTDACDLGTNNNAANAGCLSDCTDNVCGDGNLWTGTEGCDDQDTTNGDGCSATCVVEDGWYCSGAPSTCITQCGDGVKTGTEGCDDNNRDDGDGCSSSCTVEYGWDCTGDKPTSCATTCGDGEKANVEGCDDGNTNSSDGCSNICVEETGWDCSTSPNAATVCTSICGDGLLVTGEVCDTHMNVPPPAAGQGNTCPRVEKLCTNNCGELSTINHTDGCCGNGSLEAGEVCDQSDFGGETCDSRTGVLNTSSSTLSCSADCGAIGTNNCDCDEQDITCSPSTCEQTLDDGCGTQVTCPACYTCLTQSDCTACTYGQDLPKAGDSCTIITCNQPGDPQPPTKAQVCSVANCGQTLTWTDPGAPTCTIPVTCTGNSGTACSTNADCDAALGTDVAHCIAGQCSFSCYGNNACAQGASCPANATCADVAFDPSAQNYDDYTCGCNAGFTCQNGTANCQGSSCRDFDECSGENGGNNCGANTNCINTPGSFRCECQPGFTGDAYAGCTDIDECATNADDCVTNAACTNTQGGFTCTCLDGYSGNGKVSCTNINECLSDSTHTCDDVSFSVCKDKAPQIDGVKYLCECMLGYECNAGTDVGGVTDCNGGQCNNTNECADETDTCSDLADCIDKTPAQNALGYECVCKTGYFGDGFNCAAKTPCGQGQYVHNDPDATDQDYDCRTCLAMTAQPASNHYATSCDPCPSGYESGPGAAACTDIVDCGPCTTVGNQSSCIDGTNDYTCICKTNRDGAPGWTGVNCETDVDECSQSPNPCEATGEDCNNTLGDFACGCIPGTAPASGTAVLYSEDFENASIGIISDNTSGNYFVTYESDNDTDALYYDSNPYGHWAVATSCSHCGGTNNVSGKQAIIDSYWSSPQTHQSLHTKAFTPSSNEIQVEFAWAYAANNQEFVVTLNNKTSGTSERLLRKATSSGGARHSSSRSVTPGNSYELQFRFKAKYDYGARIDNILITEEGSGCQNINECSNTTTTEIISESFESGLGGFVSSGNVDFTTTSTYASVGSKAAYNDYTSYDNNYLTYNSNIDLSNCTTATLTFDHICATEDGYDYCYVKYSDNGGTSWKDFPSNRFDEGSYSGWTSVDASDWKSETLI